MSLLIGRYTTIDCMLMMMGIRAMLNRGRNKSLANYTKLSEKQSVKNIGYEKIVITVHDTRQFMARYTK